MVKSTPALEGMIEPTSTFSACHLFTGELVRSTYFVLANALARLRSWSCGLSVCDQVTLIYPSPTAIRFPWKLCMPGIANLPIFDAARGLDRPCSFRTVAQFALTAWALGGRQSTIVVAQIATDNGGTGTAGEMETGDGMNEMLIESAPHPTTELGHVMQTIRETETLRLVESHSIELLTGLATLLGMATLILLCEEQIPRQPHRSGANHPLIMVRWQSAITNGVLG